jgi:hypothetical protein
MEFSLVFIIISGFSFIHIWLITELINCYMILSIRGYFCHKKSLLLMMLALFCLLDFLFV